MLSTRSRYTRNRFKAIATLLPCMPTVLIGLVAEYDVNDHVARLIGNLISAMQTRSSWLSPMMVQDGWGEIIASLYLDGSTRRQFVSLSVRRLGYRRISVAHLADAVNAFDGSTTTAQTQHLHQGAADAVVDLLAVTFRQPIARGSSERGHDFMYIAEYIVPRLRR